METIAFFLSTLSLAVTASSAPGSVLKQFIAILLGLTALVVLGVWLRDTSRTQRLRWLMAAAAIALLSVTLVLGQTRFGAANWIILGPLSFQPSEVAKIFYIFAGSATLERLFHRRNLGLFMVLTGVCLLCLALMSDFGTALIFFATFLVIAYLRSGDFATLSLICGGALFAGLLVLNFKPYIFRRFASWGHAWEFASTTGYQQTRAMSAAASGRPGGGGGRRGLAAHRAGGGHRPRIRHAVRGVGPAHRPAGGGLYRHPGPLCRPGLPGGPLRFLYHRRLRRGLTHGGADRPEHLRGHGPAPPTVVTLPVVSNGGSAMLASWGLLAFLKASDTREKSSFAIRSPAGKEVPVP